jgi:hypothetical protein
VIVSSGAYALVLDAVSIIEEVLRGTRRMINEADRSDERSARS